MRKIFHTLTIKPANKADCCVKKFWTFELWEFKVKSRLNFSTEIVLWPILLTTYFEQGRLVEIVNNLTIIESNQKLTKNVETLPGKTVVIWVAWNHFKNMIYFKRKMIFWVTLWISQPASQTPHSWCRKTNEHLLFKYCSDKRLPEITIQK